MKNIKHSNRGGALLSVVIVMAIAGILGALAISIAYTNFTMKAVDKKSKDNFYSAEKVLEEICVGLEKEASDHYKEAYTYVMSKYNEYNDVQTMKEEFETMFVVGLIEDIQVQGNSGKWLIGTKGSNGSDPTGLYRFVKDNYGSKVTYTITTPTENGNTIDTLEDGLCLRNVNVKYQDGNYHNTITTDIKISTPDVSFAMISAMPEIGEYSYIAEGGTLVAGTELKIVGKSYSGIGPNIASNTNTTAITVNNGATFDATDTSSILLVSKGDINLKGGSTFKTGEKTALWTDSITANYISANGNRNASNLINLQGRAYVKDDTTLNGTNNTLNLAGQYYGYSNKDNDASSSSSIIINGHDTTINMAELDTLLVAGTSFVGTKGSTYNNSDITSDNILMGDSVAIKSNQLAYLVPTECEGVETNPMTYAQYGELIKNTNWKQAALDSPITALRTSLANFGNVDIVPVFSPDGTVYLYLNFVSSTKAAEYFMTYYGVNRTQVDTFVNNYLKAITFNTNTNDLTRVVTQGNYLKASATTGLKAEIATSSGDVASTAQELANYHSSYSALCKKLITNDSALTDTERSNTVYRNIVNETNVRLFVSQAVAASNAVGTGNLSSNITVDKDKNKVTIDGGAVDAIIVDNWNSASPYVVNELNNKGIIIATGDVNISGDAATTDWEGLIICGGKLTTTSGQTVLKHNPDYIGKVMQLSCEVKANGAMVPYDVLDFFTSGSNYSSSSSNDGLTLTDVRNCISYENYKSE